MRYNDRQIGGINGVLSIKTICKETGQVLDVFKDKNVITLDGMSKLWERMAGNGDIISHFVLGSDYGVEEGGDWNIFAPKPAENSYNTENQFAIYSDAPVNTVFEYPSITELQVGTLLNGERIIDELFPDEVTVRYNSASIRFGDDTIFSYKRFPVRSISRLVDVQILWTFTLVDSALFDCGIVDPPLVDPIPDHSLGISVYAGYWGDNSIHKIDDDANPLWVYNGHTDWVNDIKVNNQYLFSVGRDLSLHVLNTVDGTPFNIIPMAHASVINRILIDGDRVVTVANDSHVKKWNYVDGETVWDYSPTVSSNAMAIVKSASNGSYYVAYRDGNIVQLNSETGAEQNIISLGYEIVEIEITPENDLLVSFLDDSVGGLAYAVIRYSTTFNNTQLTIDDYDDYSFRIIYDTTGNDTAPDFYIGSDVKTVRRYTRTGLLVWEFDRHTDIIRGMDMDQFGYLYTGSLDQTVRKITPNGNQVWAYTANENPPSCIAVSISPETTP
jgi:hypothetical protein